MLKELLGGKIYAGVTTYTIKGKPGWCYAYNICAINNVCSKYYTNVFDSEFIQGLSSIFSKLILFHALIYGTLIVFLRIFIRRLLSILKMFLII
jgi:hypothetical protein